MKLPNKISATIEGNEFSVEIPDFVRFFFNPTQYTGNETTAQLWYKYWEIEENKHLRSQYEKAIYELLNFFKGALFNNTMYSPHNRYEFLSDLHYTFSNLVAKLYSITDLIENQIRVFNDLCNSIRK